MAFTNRLYGPHSIIDSLSFNIQAPPLLTTVAGHHRGGRWWPARFLQSTVFRTKKMVRYSAFIVIAGIWTVTFEVIIDPRNVLIAS